MAITNIGTGELYGTTVTGVADTVDVVGQEAVILTNSPNLYEPAGVAAIIDGVAMHDSAVGESFPVIRDGDVVVIAGASVTAPVELATNASGRFVPAVALQYCVGKALTDAAGDGDEILVNIFNKGYYLP